MPSNLVNGRRDKIWAGLDLTNVPVGWSARRPRPVVTKLKSVGPGDTGLSGSADGQLPWAWRAVPVLYLDPAFAAVLADNAFRFVQIVREFMDIGGPTPAVGVPSS